ncbi:MAG: hypothetical protein DRI69_01840 [Bacteroidetes bacterium]|nr:MAG: hypothetical protein DRI69_01840 [Bacteroidota bacterium]
MDDPVRVLPDGESLLMAKSPRLRARATAWGWFSKYIRVRDFMADTGDLKEGHCITCGKTLRFENADCGHFIPGRADSVLFNERNSHAQCVPCNRFKQGKWIEYEKAIIDRYGQAEVDRLKDLYYIKISYTEAEYRNIADMYRAKFKDICNG